MRNTAEADGRAHDVAVIGAGIIGLSIAWHLADAGVDVVVLERTGIGTGASGVQPGGVRRQWTTRLNCEMAQESVAFYRDIDDRLPSAVRARFDGCGYVFVADTEEYLAQLRSAVALQRECDVPSEILTPDALEATVPGLTAEGVVGAAYCAEDGYFDNGQAVVEAFADAADACGVEIRIADVVGLVPNRGGAWTIRTAAGPDCHAGTVVLAAGYDTPQLAAKVGVALPIEKEARYIFFSEPIRERLLEPLVVASERGFAAKQLANGRVLASDLTAREDSAANREQWRANMRAAVRSLVPILEFVSFPLLVEGFYDVTPDHQPILGPVGTDGLWVAAGFSGHGFMMAPAIGRRVAEAIRGVAAHPSLDELSLARFGRTGAAAELQIV